MNIKLKIKNKILYLLYKFGFFTLFDDISYLKIMYRLRFNKRLNLVNPKTFNEKLQWLKLYDRKDIYSTMVDKYEVKNYVSGVIGKEYTIPTLGIYNKFEDIDFSVLPNRFVMKCTHDSGSIFICKDKSSFNIDQVKNKINKSLKRNYYLFSREWPYKNVVPRIIVEEFFEDTLNKELRDYKFFCFNGKVHLFKVDFDRFINHKANYYDENKNLLKFGEMVCPPDFNKKIILPNSIDKMIELAETLSKDIPFVRVDFYDTNGNIYFGEMTFYPASGFGKFTNDKWDLKLGEWLSIPSKGE